MRKFLPILAVGFAFGVLFLFLYRKELVDKEELIYQEETRCVPVVAVLPGFTPVGPGANLLYLAQGVGGNLESQLVKNKGVAILISSSPPTNLASALEFAAAKGVDFLVNGSVKLVDDQIQITVALFDVKLNKQHWRRGYEADLSAYLEMTKHPINLQIAQDILANVPKSVRRTASQQWQCITPRD